MTESLVQLVADYLRLTTKDVMTLAARAPTSYRSYRIEKRNGGTRLIFHPSKETKALQYALITTFLAGLPVHEAAFAYRKGIRSPLRQNAAKHSKFSYTIRLDVENFFPTIGPKVLRSALANLGDDRGGSLEVRDREFLKGCLFVRAGRRGLGLAIGAPSSPAVSNFVMYNVDITLKHLADELSGEYTRYADDLYFSTDVKGGCGAFARKVEKVLREEVSSEFRLNERKTFFMSRGTRRVVCGVVLCPDGGVSIGRARKRYIRKLLNEMRYDRLSGEAQLHLQGYLAFALDVEPDFYNRLALKYGGGLVRVALQGGGG